MFNVVKFRTIKLWYSPLYWIRTETHNLRINFELFLNLPKSKQNVPLTRKFAEIYCVSPCLFIETEQKKRNKKNLSSNKLLKSKNFYTIYIYCRILNGQTKSGKSNFVFSIEEKVNFLFALRTTYINYVKRKGKIHFDLLLYLCTTRWGLNWNWFCCCVLFCVWDWIE